MTPRHKFNKVFFEIFKKTFLIFYNGYPTHRCIIYSSCRDTNVQPFVGTDIEPLELMPGEKAKAKSSFSGSTQLLLGLSVLGYYLCKAYERDNVQQQQQLPEANCQSGDYAKAYRYTQMPRPPR